ncbi:carbohydrate ABC transporter membrane protein 2 (CUT1 family) [Plasticicumulans lactativorans]|uniref:Carbohydrate ABC transporter membrane protein 2 (CUT1 family) n=1 Tax=Plasticicumulans lactativorans TaxID=1133106 RepID=A0A4R2L7J4_9GAMM|nr:carbohydrate ABC transporter permease [Plasticicumulans lactativorans]TCO81290.1 carbohydrate ABC transporter membrane protein 2 (CUT1 family) [Plasticicumulans lactativorans]
MSASTLLQKFGWRRLSRLEIVQLVSLTIIAIVVVSPLIILVVASLKPDRFAILADMGSMRAFWVDDPTLNNYREILSFDGALPFGRYLVNSVFILLTTVTGGLLINSMAAFVLAWGQMRGRAVILSVLIALYIIPQESIVMPLLVLVNKLGMSDGFSAQILPWMASPIYIFLFYQFFKQVPKDIVEAARMDGASLFRIYWSIFVPLSLPVMATVTILLGIDMWNQYLWPMLVTQSDYARPISVAIAGFFGQDTVFWNTAMAASVLMMVPVLVFYLFFQKWFMNSFAGAVKG